MAGEGIPRGCVFEVLVRRKMLGGSMCYCANGLMVRGFCFC